MFDETKFYDTVAVQKTLGLSYTVLAKWRHYGRGPSYLKLGTRVLYKGADLNEWLERQRVETGALT